MPDARDSPARPQTQHGGRRKDHAMIAQASDMRYFESALEIVGNTPLVRLNRVMDDASCLVLAKIEFVNPGGSVKDRPAVAMLREAERDGSLGPGSTIVEATSGNTGVGLAMAAAIRG